MINISSLLFSISGRGLFAVGDCVHHDQGNRRCKGCKGDPEGGRTDIVAVDGGHPGLDVVRLHVDHIVLLEVVGRRGDKALGRGEVDNVGFLAAVVVAQEGNVVALAIDREVSGVADGVKDRGGVLLYCEGSRLVDFAEDLVVEVQVFDGNDGAGGLALDFKFVLDLVGDLGPGESGDIDLAEDREADVAVLVHGVAGGVV